MYKIHATITLTTLDGHRIVRLRDDVSVDPTSPSNSSIVYVLDGRMRGPSVWEDLWASGMMMPREIFTGQARAITF